MINPIKLPIGDYTLGVIIEKIKYVTVETSLVITIIDEVVLDAGLDMDGPNANTLIGLENLTGSYNPHRAFTIRCTVTKSTQNPAPGFTLSYSWKLFKSGSEEVGFFDDEISTVHSDRG